MKKLILLLISLTIARADTLLVSDFSHFTVGYYSQSDQGPWSDDTALAGADTFAIGDFGHGTPGGNIGNGFIQWLGDTPQDWSAYAYVTLTGFTAPANETGFLGFYLEDINGTASTLTQFALGDFGGALASITLPVLAGGVDLTQIAFWGFTVSDAANPAFGFSFDELALSDTVPSPVPDTSSAGLLFGFALLGLAGVRRRARRA